MAFRVDLTSSSSSLAAFMVGLTYLIVMKVDQKGCSFTSCFSGRILFSSSLDLNTSEPRTDYVSGKYCESMKRKKRWVVLGRTRNTTYIYVVVCQILLYCTQNGCLESITHRLYVVYLWLIMQCICKRLSKVCFVCAAVKCRLVPQ